MNYNQERRLVVGAKSGASTGGTALSIRLRTDANGRGVVRLAEAVEGFRESAVLLAPDEVDQISADLKEMSALCREYNAALDETARKKAVDPLHCLAAATETVVDKESIVDKDEEHVTISLTREEYEAIRTALQEAKKAVFGVRSSS